jgi:TorA maturation chaperone TorD
MDASAIENEPLRSDAFHRLRPFCEAVAEDLSLLASLHDAEPEADYLEGMRKIGIQQSLGFKLKSELGTQAIEVLTEALAALPEGLDRKSLDELAADFASIYLTHGLHASPLESVWIDEENLVCQDTMFQVRAWYKQYGLVAPDWRKRPDDHLVYQLQFVARLFGRARTVGSLEDAARFMDEHLLRWLMHFAERVAARCGSAYFAGTAVLTAAYCEELRELLIDILGEPRPSKEEIDQRMKPKQGVEEVPVKFMPGIGPVV